LQIVVLGNIYASDLPDSQD